MLSEDKDDLQILDDQSTLFNWREGIV